MCMYVCVCVCMCVCLDRDRGEMFGFPISANVVSVEEFEEWQVCVYVCMYVCMYVECCESGGV